MHVIAVHDDIRLILSQSRLKGEKNRCADGDRALRALKFADGAFDMLLTDIMMPGMDGIELAKQAEVLSPGIKIMFITGFAAVAMSDVGASEQTVLSKPVHLRQLVDEVDKLIAA